MTKWNPIETAPKDRPVILAIKEHKWTGKSQWSDEKGGWSMISNDKNTPIAWQEWPAHPYSEEEANEHD